MVYDDSWVGLGELSPSSSSLDVEPFAAVQIAWIQDTATTDDDDEKVTAVVQIAGGNDSSAAFSGSALIALHPVLADTLMQAADLKLSVSPAQPTTSDIPQRLPSQSIGESNMVKVQALPIPRFFDCTQEESSASHLWRLDKLQVVQAPSNLHLVLKCLCVDQEFLIDAGKDELLILEHSLQDRLVKQGSVLVLSALGGFCIAIVQDISSCGATAYSCYRLGSLGTFSVDAIDWPTLDQSVVESTTTSWQSSTPGYEHLATEILSLLVQQEGTTASSSSRPSGIVLSGCAGVGKSHVASFVAHKLTTKDWTIHWVSLADVLLLANAAGIEELVTALTGSARPRRRILVVIDDMDVVASENAEDWPNWDQERRLVVIALLQAIDCIVEQRHATVLALCRSTTRLPSDLFKAGRLEKHVTMESPTQLQREAMLLRIMRNGCVQETSWAEALASLTAGCVASDLCHIATAATAGARARRCVEEGPSLELQNLSTELAATIPQTASSWEDWKEAARTHVPSQLQLLDVRKPMIDSDAVIGPSNWLQIHQQSWQKLAGSDALKRRVYRSIILPWRRQMHNAAGSPLSNNAIVPPTGVLFHGAPGVGKTLAAHCLGSSLGLPMIAVTAADVLDRWLGGSEAVLRSLFARTKAAAPCILFLDEIDSIVTNRGVDEDVSTDVTSRILSTLLNEMDGVSSGGAAGDKILVVACTNRMETLDAALLRPGRLEEHVELVLPQVEDAAAILQHHLARVPLQDDLPKEMHSLAQTLVSRMASAAVIEGVAREAVQLALRRCNEEETLQLAGSDVKQATDLLLR